VAGSPDSMRWQNPTKEDTKDLQKQNTLETVRSTRSAMNPLPLDHIRLLHIEAGVDESPIRCRLVTTSLEASPPYEALSIS
jgi:hypothetical protein